ncbi:MAG: bifunctional UDP-N-acetylglucosamine diphosphorylase/glucosamine-1-phosphate N-acetyltransferase GlmU [Actinobacteria bacterium]|nr:bifunctional UDP-N-acetylglucosamine diphosphorylase/glucosamine-1-phosphate N-acetyltransferase GlmU [Actinomycetota bacterium]
MGEPRPQTAAIVLAAGHGSRMRSARPKVLHGTAGRPLLLHVLAALQPLELARSVVVVSPAGRDQVEAACSSFGFEDGIIYATQESPRGTAEAVSAGLDSLTGGSESSVLVVAGDTPLLRTETLRALLDLHVARAPSATLVTARMEDPTGYGRILRGYGDEVEKIVEERDASALERSVKEVNAGVYVFDAVRLGEVLGKVDDANAQGEFYLPDVVGLLRSGNEPVLALGADASEVQGVNSRSDLANAGELLRLRACEYWMSEGVTIVDPRTTYIDASVSIGRDAVIRPFSFLEGRTIIEDGAEVGPQARVVDSVVGEHATVSFAVVKKSTLEAETSVGPFASLRPGTTLERGAHVGTFVETKNSRIGEGSKANHLSYLGDAEIGNGVNIGAGTITANFDGRNKNKTVIEDEAYIGSDTTMVAPVRIGKRAATGAGAVVRTDVPDDALAVGVPARNIEGKGNKMGKGENGATADP